MVEGLDRLVRQMKAIPLAIRDEAKAAIQEEADELARAIAAAAPTSRGGGDLKNSVRVERGGSEDVARSTGELKSQAGLAVRVVAGDEKAFYASFVEFGTAPHSMAPRADLSSGKKQDGPQHPGSKAEPFFYPTIRATRKRRRSKMGRRLNKAVKAAAGKS